MKERGIGIEVEGEREKERIERRRGERNREERKMSKSHLSTSPRSSSGIASSSSIRLLSSSEGTQPLNFPRPVSPLGRIDTAVPFIHEDSKCEKGVVPIKGAGVSGQCSNMCERVCICVHEYLGVVCKGGGERPETGEARRERQGRGKDVITMLGPTSAISGVSSAPDRSHPSSSEYGSAFSVLEQPFPASVMAALPTRPDWDLGSSPPPPPRTPASSTAAARVAG